MSDADAVTAANAAFYAAFEARDLDAMAEVWERTDRAVCTHPGWPTLRGWARVATSWEAIFHNTPGIQFVLTDEHVTVEGDTAWVSVTENILQGVSVHASSAAALNLFVRRSPDAPWRLVVHHGSPVAEQ
jgi:ketosteroid isomerase-like protein